MLFNVAVEKNTRKVFVGWRLNATTGNFNFQFFMLLLQNILYEKAWTLLGEAALEFCHEKLSLPRKRIEKRSTRQYFVGRVRGQTQSQYLNYGNGQEPGKAEAESSYEGSRAVVCKFKLLHNFFCKFLNVFFSPIYDILIVVELLLS